MAEGQISEDNTTMSFVIPKTLKEELGFIAAKENRSMSNLLCTLVDNYVQLNKQQERLAAYYNLISNMNIATYQTTPEKHGNGYFFFTDCGHNMYSVRDDMAYHGCLCPACLSKGIQTILYIRGSKESNEYWNNKLKKR